MNEGRSRRPQGPRREPDIGSTLLALEALGLAGLAAAFLGAGGGVGAACWLILAAVAAGLGASIGEGLPHAGGAVLGFEGVVVAFAASLVSLVGAVTVLVVTGAALRWTRHHGGVAQIRRPVPSQ
jgi:hypothetical protein